MLYDLLDSLHMQVYLTKIMLTLKNIIFEKTGSITDKSEKQQQKKFAAQNSVLTNLNEMVKKRNDIINQFANGNIITKSEKFFDAPKKITESVTEKESKEKSDQSIPI